MEQISDDAVTSVLKNRYAVKQVLNYYLRKATDAMRQAEVALTGPNVELYISHSKTVFDNLKMIDRILADDKNQISDGKSQTKT